MSRSLSARAIFVAIMTVAGSLSAGVTALDFLHGQADYMSDLIKAVSLCALATAGVSFTLWSVLSPTSAQWQRGALAGVATAGTVLMLPFAAYAVKAGLSADLGLSDLLRSTVVSGASIFVLKTKLSLAALIGGAVVGGMSARMLATQRLKTSVTSDRQ